jgi:hypothetical protein
MVMHRAFLLAMRAGKAGSRSMDQLEINPLPGDILHQLRNSPWVLKAEETLIVPRYFQRGLKRWLAF